MMGNLVLKGSNSSSSAVVLGSLIFKFNYQLDYLYVCIQETKKLTFNLSL